MTAYKGVDYSYSVPSVRSLVAFGTHFVARYITDPGPGNKGIGQTEWDALTDNNLRVIFVWEGTGEGDASAALHGFARGHQDALAAQKNLEALSGPSHNRPLYFAVDFDAQPDQYGKIGSYFEGVASVIGLNRTRVYGGIKIASYLKTHRLVTGAWQTYAWSGGVLLKGVDVYQHENGVAIGGGTVDLNTSFTDNYGQKSVYPPKASTAHKAKATAKSTPVYITIKSGDTLTAIASRYHTTVRALESLNKLRNPDLIRADAKLRIK